MRSDRAPVRQQHHHLAGGVGRRGVEREQKSGSHCEPPSRKKKEEREAGEAGLGAWRQLKHRTSSHANLEPGPLPCHGVEDSGPLSHHRRLVARNSEKCHHVSGEVTPTHKTRRRGKD